MRTPTTIAWAMFWALVLVTALVLWENKQLSLRLAAERGDVLPDRITSLSGAGLEAQLREIQFEANRGYVVFTFSRTCPYCRASMAHWRSLAETLDPEKWQVLWVSRDSVDSARQFATEEGITQPVLAAVSYRTFRQLGLVVVPRTIVIAPTGVVLGSETGVVDDAIAGRIQALTSLSGPLPKAVGAEGEAKR